MDNPKRDVVDAWLAKAEEDLEVARLLVANEQRLLSAGVYHCQQAAEKALKAWLTCCDVVFPKTHDLEALLHLGRPAAPGFGDYVEHARRLTPLATEYRYPGDLASPPLREAQHALVLSEELVAYVRRLITDRSWT